MASAPTDAGVFEAIEEIALDEEVEVGLVLLPRLALGREALGRWVEVLRKAHAAAHGGRALLAIEGFHPDAEADIGAAERLTPFVRRTPDPTLQLTRLAVLEKVRRGSPQGTAFFDMTKNDLSVLLGSEEKKSIHERIAEANLGTVRRLGVDEVRRRMDDILRDRDRAFTAVDPSVPRRLPPTP